MAKQQPSSNSPTDKDSFLGGGVQFNKVGTSIPGSSSLPAGEEPVLVASPAQARTRTARTLVIVAALLLLIVLLFVFGNDGINGIQHTVGRGGVSSSSHTAAPPRNF